MNKVIFIILSVFLTIGHLQTSYPKSLVIFPLEFKFVDPRHSTGTCCADLSTNVTCSKYCQIHIVLFHNNKYTLIVDIPYPVPSIIWPNEEVHIANYLSFSTNMAFSIHAYDSTYLQLVDIWSLTISMDSFSGNTILDQRSGQFGNAKFSALLKWACPRNYGINCLNECRGVNQNNYCDSTGALRCKPPYVGPPQCSSRGNPCDDRPCLNGGTCRTNPDNNLDYICTCPTTYGGKNCDILSCTTENCGSNGTCIEGTCVCDEGFHGSYCEGVRCSAGICQNGGRCEVNNNVHSCVCLGENILGEFCQYRCKPGCLYGTCQLNKDGNEASCNCFDGYGGIICDIFLGSGSSSKKKQNDIIKIVVPIVVILAVIALVGGLTYYFISKNKSIKIFTQKNSDASSL